MAFLGDLPASYNLSNRAEGLGAPDRVSGGSAEVRGLCFSAGEPEEVFEQGSDF